MNRLIRGELTAHVVLSRISDQLTNTKILRNLSLYHARVTLQKNKRS